MDRSAWWLLLLVPPITVIGVFVLLVMSIFSGTPGPNRYGPDPLQLRQFRNGFDHDPQEDPYGHQTHETNFIAPPMTTSRPVPRNSRTLGHIYTARSAERRSRGMPVTVSTAALAFDLQTPASPVQGNPTLPARFVE